MTRKGNKIIFYPIENFPFSFKFYTYNINNVQLNYTVIRNVALMLVPVDIMRVAHCDVIMARKLIAFFTLNFVFSLMIRMLEVWIDSTSPEVNDLDCHIR